MDFEISDSKKVVFYENKSIKKGSKMNDSERTDSNTIKILSEPTEKRPFILVWKPKGLPSAPLTSDDKDNAFSQAAKLFPNLYQVQGRKEIEHGLLHRIDTQTDGLLLIAESQDFYDYMMNEQKEGRFIKKYRATCIFKPDNARILGGFPADLSDGITRPLKAPQKSGEQPRTASKTNKVLGTTFKISSYFRPYGEKGSLVRPVTEASGPAALKKCGKKVLYTTKVTVLQSQEPQAGRKPSTTAVSSDQATTHIQQQTTTPAHIQVECQIAAGFRHQVRCHLAWLGLPIIGDSLYNADCLAEIENKKMDEDLNFSAVGLEFYTPEKILIKVNSKGIE